MTSPVGPAWPAYPIAPSPLERIRMAYQRRHESDYIFSFWSAFGWYVLTFGIFGLYVGYQLMRRSRDHARRRLELLDATTSYAWDRAVAQGKSDELRPKFEQVAIHLDPLRRMSHDFRDPVVWVVLEVVSGIAYYVALVLLDQDLVKHEANERVAQAYLADILSAVGVSLAPPPAPTKRQHNYAGRIVATIFSFGIYGLWWTANAMNDGNEHFTGDWLWEDELATAVQAAG